MLEKLTQLFGWSISPVHTYHFKTGHLEIPIKNGKAIQALVDTTILSITAPDVEGDTLVGTVIPAGLTIYVRHSDIEITGEVICYGG